MKKAFTILFALFFLCGGFLQAQAVKSIAVKSGIVWSTQNWDYKNTNVDFQNEYRTGFHVGVNIEFLHHEYFSILAELGFAQKGFKMEVDITTPDHPEANLGTKEFKFAYKYAYLSPMFKARKEFGGFVPYIFIGPRLDYQLEYPSEFSSEGSKNYYNDFIFGMTYGLGIEYMFGPVGVDLIFQHQYDFTSLYKRDPTEETPTGLSIKNNAFIVDLGVKFYFGKE